MNNAKVFKILVPFFLIVTFVLVILLYKSCFIITWLSKQNRKVLFFVETQNKNLALTIDDGPHHSVTPQILNVLLAYDSKATFFLIGDKIKDNETIIKRMVEEGHEIGNHLMYESASIFLESQEFKNQLKLTHEILSGFGPIRWMRPGSGWYSERMLCDISEYGYTCALGSVYPYDPYISNVNFISNFILRNVFPGAIIILHEGKVSRQHTVEVLRLIIPQIKKKGYKIVTLTELMEITKTSFPN
jgi:peptidoglycan/xylan/chitin deacetylase (PgdA/CDA1 family)